MPLIQFLYKIEFFVFKRVYKIRSLIKINIECRIRYLEPNAKLEGYDKKFDSLIHITALKLLYPEFFEENAPEFLLEGLSDEVKNNLQTQYFSNKLEIDRLLSVANRDEEIPNLVLNHYLIQHFINNYLKQKTKAEYYLANAQKLNSGVSALSMSNVYLLRKPLKKKIRKLREEIGDRQAIKLGLSLEKFGILIPIISAFFLVSGYLF